MNFLGSVRTAVTMAILLAPAPVQAIGIFGQHLYVNPVEKLVIVVLSARPKPTGSTAIDDLAFFGAVAKALKARSPSE